VLQLCDAARELVKAPTAKPRSTHVNGDARPTGVHDAARTVDEVRAEYDLIARDGVQDGNAVGLWQRRYLGRVRMKT
jgi:hypothetical protein